MQGMEAAFTVLKIVEKFADKNEKLDWYKEAYCNGREQGFAIIGDNAEGCWQNKVAFSENRNSDDIVVYCGTNKPGCFDMYGNVPSDDVYKEATYFRYNQTKEAANFIISRLQGEQNATNAQ